MSAGAKRIGCWWAAACLLIAALYAAMGVLQAGSIHVGERALVQLRWWGSASLLCLFASGFFLVCAIRLRKRAPRRYPATAADQEAGVAEVTEAGERTLRVDD